MTAEVHTARHVVVGLSRRDVVAALVVTPIDLPDPARPRGVWRSPPRPQVGRDRACPAPPAGPGPRVGRAG